MSNENQDGMLSCPVICWLIGALLGIATWLILSGRYGMSTILALIIGLVVMIGVAWLLSRLFCTQVTETDYSSSGRGAPHAEVESMAAARAVSATGIDSGGAMAAPVSPAAVAPDTGATTRELEEEAEAKPEKTAAKKPTAEKTDAKPAPKPVAADGKPEMLSGPRATGADDLKQIKGVGPKLEKQLNTMGIYHFDQVASWRSQEVAWVDENLQGFKGRVSRDEWVEQAKVLAKGGATEFSNRVKKGDVY